MSINLSIYHKLQPLSKSECRMQLKLIVLCVQLLLCIYKLVVCYVFVRETEKEERDVKCIKPHQFIIDWYSKTNLRIYSDIRYKTTQLKLVHKLYKSHKLSEPIDPLFLAI